MNKKTVNGVVFEELASTGFRAWSNGCAFSIVVKTADGKKFKITHDSGNCYSHTRLFVMMPTLEWQGVADESDISGCNIKYYWNEDDKIRMMESIYGIVLVYIISVFL